MKRIFFFSVFFVGFFISCAPNKELETNRSKRQLVFGEGGGFVGGTKTYILYDSGQLFYIHSIGGEQQELNPIEKKLCKKVFKKAKRLSLATIEIERPGNIYYFLEIRDNKNKNRVSWGDPNYKLPGELMEFYQFLNDTIKPPV